MTIRKRTQEDVIDYIKSHASDGKLRESLMDIAESLGYSNATIHRTLKSLEKQGVIELLPPEKPTQPNTIIYNGPITMTDDILRQGAELMNEVEKLSARVSEYVREAQRVLHALKESQGETTSDLESRITEIVDMPDGKHQMLIVRKTPENMHPNQSHSEVQTQ